MKQKRNISAGQYCPQLIERFAAGCRENRRNAIDSAKRQYSDLQKKRDVSRDEKKKRLDQLQIKIRELEDPLVPFHGELIKFFVIKVGDIGWFDKRENDRRAYIRYEVKALQIIDEENALVTVSVMPGTAPGLANTEKAMWVKGLNTSNLETGGEVDLSGVISVTGTTTYETTDGTNTVLVLQVADAKKYEELFTRKGEKRLWTSKSGKFTTDAIYTRFENGRATLVGLDGKVMKVRPDELSEADREFINGQINAQRTTK